VGRAGHRTATVHDLSSTRHLVPAGTPEQPPDFERWFTDHYDSAAQEIVDFVTADGFPLAGIAMADIGSGDGVIDLGVLHKAEPAKIVGYDINVTDVEALRGFAADAALAKPFPDADRLAFVESGLDHIPAASASFDVVYSWSTFEHVSQPTRMLAEVRRVLRPHGVFFLQIWPLYHSLHGGHLWYLIREAFAHLLLSEDEIRATIEGKLATDPRRRDAWDEFQSLNQLTLDELDRALLMAGLRPSKVELMSEVVHLPPDLGHVPLTALAISGVKLLASPV
jgi:SAM-dependent methyltransferase